MWWGEDNFEFGWPRRHPRLHDILCKNVVLVGKNFTTADLLPREPRDKAVTGAYTPFGVPTEEGQVIHGMVPCSGAIMGVPLRGG
ncbi:MAG: glucose dehydrogenase, partial [Nitrospiraceae bacterium]